ncbi:MAG: phosphodiester glycosidase family protein, partial [bacterium]
DGRQPLASIGTNLYDLADYLLSLGAWEAMNLDGGGSTTMWVSGQVVNRPSDAGGPRTVSSGLLVVSSQPIGPASKLDILPANAAAPAGTQVRFSAKVFDDNFNALDVDQTQLSWNCSKWLGEIDAEGLLKLHGDARDGIVEVRLGGNLQASEPVHVVKIGKIRTEPPYLLVRNQEPLPFELRMYTESGVRVRTPLEGLLWEVRPPALARVNPGPIVEGLTTGTGQLMTRIGGRPFEIPIAVNLERRLELESFDRPNAKWNAASVEGNHFNREKTTFEVGDSAHNGSGALWVDYYLEHGGTSIISVPLDADVETTPVALSLWVDGDGKGLWLRGEVVDADGEEFVLDFSSGGEGITWEGWERREVLVSDWKAKKTNQKSRLNFPVRMKRLYFQQGQEAAKKDGKVALDALEAVYPPSPDQKRP